MGVVYVVYGDYTSREVIKVVWSLTEALKIASDEKRFYNTIEVIKYSELLDGTTKEERVY